MLELIFLPTRLSCDNRREKKTNDDIALPN